MIKMANNESKTWAIVNKKTNTVENTVLWDGVTEYNYGSQNDAIEITKGMLVNIGYTYKDGEFTPPPLTEEEKQQQEQSLIVSNLTMKQALFSQSTLRISVLQDAVDLEMATDEESALLPLWKKYRVLLSRVDASTAGEIEWPEKPE